MAGYGLPNAATLATLDTLERIRQWCRCDLPTWQAVDRALGGVADATWFAMLPVSLLRSTLRSVRVGTPARELHAMETIHIAYMWRVARQTLGMSDLDPLADPTPSPAVAVAAPTGGMQKKIKASSVTDQMDDTEINLMSRTELDEAHAYHIEMTGAEPADESEPTGEQISALRDRIVKRGERPYADFSILTPYGRTMQKQLKTRSWVMQQDGSFRALDVPGPPSFDAWAACWKVFRAILYMLRYPAAVGGNPLRVVTQACLEEYFERVAKLNNDYPEAWHLLMKAEDKCRSEMFERYRRQLTKAAAENRLPMGLEFNPLQPWIGVFTYAARHKDFWDEHVVGPAMLFIARGGRKITADAAQSMRMTEPAQEALNLTPEAATKKRKKPKEQPAPLVPSPSAPHPTPRTPKKGKKKPPPILSPGESITLPRRRVRRYASGLQKGSRVEEPCRDSRAHVCQFCLGKHPNNQCDQAPKGGKAAGKGKNKN
eukprot:s203_g48.t1